MSSRILPLACAVVLAALSAVAQNVISAKAGYVNYAHGDVVLPLGRDGQQVRQLEPGQTAATGHGRVELLLTPGSFLRLDHESEVRLVATGLHDVRVELISGTANVEVNEVLKGTALAVSWREHVIPITRTGLYRFEANADSMRVYVEKGKLQLAGMKGWLKSNKYVDVSDSGALSAAGKYKGKDLDEFDRWTRVRGEELALASFSAAGALLRGGSLFRSSIWALDPFLGFYTYLPYSWNVVSPFGYRYYSPRVPYARNREHPGDGSVADAPRGGRRHEGGSNSGGGSAGGPSSPRPGPPDRGTGRGDHRGGHDWKGARGDGSSGGSGAVGPRPPDRGGSSGPRTGGHEWRGGHGGGSGGGSGTVGPRPADGGGRAPSPGGRAGKGGRQEPASP